MARGKLECQCQLFWERDDRRAETTFWSTGNFNVMTEKSNLLCFNDGGRQKKASAGQALHKGFGRECALIEGREL